MATIKYWDGSAWQYAVVGKQGPVGPTGPTGPVGQASLQRFRFVATGGETSLSGTDANGNTLAYTAGLEEVFINGAAQVRGQDYTATNGTSITGLTALVASDVVEILAWGVFNVSNTISNTLVDAKGDLLVGSAADTVSRLAVGSNNTVLTADSSTATGLKWATPSSPVKQIVSVNSDSYTSIGSSSGWVDVAGLTASITPTSTSSDILVYATVPTNLANQSNTVADVKFKLFRGATELEEWGRAMRIDAGTGSSSYIQLAGTFATIYKDSPASTSSLTYKFQFSCTGSNVSAAASVGGMMSIILMEI